MFDPQLDRVFRALANTNRRWIIERLSDCDASVIELAEAFAISFRGVLDHVRVLERCGLVQRSRYGRLRSCHLNADSLLAAEQWMRHTLWASQRGRLGSLPQDWHPRERPEGG